ncbi:hypothetical protein B1218_34870, partial [Pseudomonas ogarae]
WGAAMGTGLLTALLSSVMHNWPTGLSGALSIEERQATGGGKEGTIDANGSGEEPGPQSRQTASQATGVVRRGGGRVMAGGRGESRRGGSGERGTLTAFAGGEEGGNDRKKGGDGGERGPAGTVKQKTIDGGVTRNAWGARNRGKQRL